MLVTALARFGPLVAWMGLIALLSTSLFGADRTGSLLLSVLAELLAGAGSTVLHGLHTIIRKMGHLIEYGILGALWLRALAPGGTATGGGRAAALAVALAAGYGVADEALQGLSPNRSPAAHDVAIDAIGAALGVAALQSRGALARVGLRLGWWAAAAVAGGSLASAVVDWSLGLPAWDLVVAALGAALAAWALRRIACIRIGRFTNGATGVSSSPPPRTSM